MRARRKPPSVVHKVFFRRRAEDRLTELYDYIASQGSPQTAIDYVTRIRVACMALATFPERGRRRDDILPGLRVIGFERRVTIAFRVLKTRVEIVSIAYGGRDFERELRKGK
jgi:toxin ParE1/3/4